VNFDNLLFTVLLGEYAVNICRYWPPNQ